MQRVLFLRIPKYLQALLLPKHFFQEPAWDHIREIFSSFFIKHYKPDKDRQEEQRLVFIHLLLQKKDRFGILRSAWVFEQRENFGLT